MRDKKTYPEISASFGIEGVDLDLEAFTKAIGIQPTETRTKEQWPKIRFEMIDKLAIEDKPRALWWYTVSRNNCFEADIVLREIVSVLKDKIKIIQDFCNPPYIYTDFVLRARAYDMSKPDIVISANVSKFLSEINSELLLDIEYEHLGGVGDDDDDFEMLTL
jgi:hypothetical protein